VARSKILIWHAVVCLDCTPPSTIAVTDAAVTDEHRQRAIAAEHRRLHPHHRLIAFTFPGYGGESYAAVAAVTSLLSALSDMTNRGTP
jgi:hypothetical protein